MLRAYRSHDIRQAEVPLLAAGTPLMQRAAAATAFETVAELRRRGIGISGTSVLALVGAGNNGGDALFAAARLAQRGMQVSALCLGSCHEQGLAAARRARVRIHSLDEATGGSSEFIESLALPAVVWLDGLGGIGARGALREPMATLVESLEEVRRMRAHEPITIAIDVPTGVGSDDGVVVGPALHADVTVTMGASKPGLILDPGCRYAGQVVEVPLGIEEFLPPEPALLSLSEADVLDLWDIPGPSSHKYTRGVVGLMTGSDSYPGAALLSAGAALAAGPGMVRYAGPKDVRRMVIARYPEIVTAPGRVQCWVIGSGMDMAETEAVAEAARRLQESVADGFPVVLDAGAIELAVETDLPSTVVLTPHAGELAQLLTGRGEVTTRADVENAPARYARIAATLTGATILLKGSVDIACGPDDPLYAQGGAPAWRGVAGAGDVQAGLLGAMLAGWGDELAELGQGRGIPARIAAAASWVHGRAAHIAAGPGRGRPITASQISAAIGSAIGDALAN